MKGLRGIFGAVALLAFVVTCLPPSAWGASARFESTSQGILDALTETPQSVGTSGGFGVIQARKAPSVNLKIEFDVDSDQIRSESVQVLQALGKALVNPRLADKAIVIKGHTDADGSAEHNKALSIRRANAVRQYLVANFSIPERRLKATGYGHRMPLVKNTTPENKSKNRRVEIEVED